MSPPPLNSVPFFEEAQYVKKECYSSFLTFEIASLPNVPGHVPGHGTYFLSQVLIFVFGQLNDSKYKMKNIIIVFSKHKNVENRRSKYNVKYVVLKTLPSHRNGTKIKKKN